MLYRFWLVVFLAATSAAHPRCSGWKSGGGFLQQVRNIFGPSRQKCEVTAPRDFAVYDHTFVFIQDGKKIGAEHDLGRFLQHHHCAGRTTNASIVEEGRKAVAFFEEGYGLDLSNVTDDDMLEGNVMVHGGKLRFEPFIINPNTNYRLISETDACGGRLHRNVPVSDAGWTLTVVEPTEANGTHFTGKLGLPDTFLFYADYLFTTSYGYRSRPTVIHYESRYPSVDIGLRFQFFEAALYSDLYGEGYTVGIFELDFKTRNIQGREVLTFPKRK